ncbi:MAG: hypothetical protein H7A23_13300 [Leptospiraceae bacterium]|nr:hypothetical protein [Leptospiraceae bacterium]MCP5495526.1 hypothetical protein [Leptospiraceae bacterium]
MTDNEIFQGVCESLSNALDIPTEDIKETDKIIDDLGADSLDLLDLIFQLEQKFKIKIKPGDIERRTKAELGDVPLTVDGVYTPEALELVRKHLPEVPSGELPENFQASKLPRVFRVKTFMNLVKRVVEEKENV